MGNNGKMQVVKAPLPGKVVDVKVNPGDSVRRGELLVILEAMKMYHRILAPADGVVQSISVKSGIMVNTNEPLVSLAVN